MSLPRQCAPGLYSWRRRCGFAPSAACRRYRPTSLALAYHTCLLSSWCRREHAPLPSRKQRLSERNTTEVQPRVNPVGQRRGQEAEGRREIRLPVGAGWVRWLWVRVCARASCADQAESKVTISVRAGAQPAPCIGKCWEALGSIANRGTSNGRVRDPRAAG